MPALRYPMSGIAEPRISTFVPCAFQMYYIIHIMDDIMRKSFYFLRREDAWHPFISRIFFGILFIIQTLRCELTTRIITPEKLEILQDFIDANPLEKLFIPGPLVALFKALAVGKSSVSLVGNITPKIPDIIGVPEAQWLIALDDNHIANLLLPKIPGLLAFFQKLTTAPENNIPDFTIPSTFDNTRETTLLGSNFQVGAWTPVQRTFLLTPGLIYSPETTTGIDASFNRFGKRLRLPQFIATTPLDTLRDFMQFRDLRWFSLVAQIMSSYAKFFKGSRSLAECSGSPTATPLIRSNFTKSCSQTPATNPVNALTHAFPETTPFAAPIRHSSYKLDIPPAVTLTALSSELNMSTTVEHLGPWSRLGSHDITHFGPYWNRIPLVKTLEYEVFSSALPTIKTNDFSLPREATEKP